MKFKEESSQLKVQKYMKQLRTTETINVWVNIKDYLLYYLQSISKQNLKKQYYSCRIKTYENNNIKGRNE